jgi:hypothetical protein
LDDIVAESKIHSDTQFQDLSSIQPLLPTAQISVYASGLFHAVSLLLSANSKLCDAIADRRHVAGVTRDIHFFAGPVVIEMLCAAHSSQNVCNIFLSCSTVFIENVKKASAMLDSYLVFHLAANPANGLQLGPLLHELWSLSENIVLLKSSRTTLEMRGET